MRNDERARGRRHRYQQIADELRGEIEAGRWAPGAQLPSTEELIRRFSVARMTVRSAVSQLHRDGLVFTRHGRGVFVARLDQRRETSESVELDAEAGPVIERLDELGARLDDGFGDLHERLNAIESRLV